MKTTSSKNKKTLSRVFDYIGRYKYLLPISILMALISVALTLYVPVLIGEAIDCMLGEGMVDLKKVVQLLGVGAFLILCTALCQWIMSTVNNRIAFHVSRDIRNEAFTRIHKLPLSYIDSTPHGEVVNRVINDTERFSEGLLLGFTQVFTGVLTIVGTLAFMLVISWQIALVVFLITPLSIFIAKFIGSRTYNMFKERSEAEAVSSAHIAEILGNQKTVKAFGREMNATERFNEIEDRVGKSTLRAIFFSSLTNPTTRFVNSVVYAAVALVGALMVIESSSAVAVALTIGEFSVLLSYTNQYTKPFNEISGIFAEFQNALASAARVFDLIEEESEIADKADAKELSEVDGEVRLSNVDFSYNKEKELIKGLNLLATPGQRIAIVGPTGCGKTTVINLLMRFYDVDAGSISVDGRDIRELTRSSLRQNFGMVLQDTWIAQGTIKENIAFGADEATDEDIVKAAKAAHAHSFIKRLEKGYDTKVGEGGEGLSQGQKQLISIARIMLKLPPMLILDEATSSIDTRTEIRIQKAFSEMMKGRTSFIVAHRLSTVKEADLILVMKDGQIIETGNHTELLAKNGFYRKLYDSQFAH